MAEPSDPAKTPEKKPAKAAEDTKKTADTKDAPAKPTADAKSASATKSGSVPSGSGKPAESQAKTETTTGNTGGGGRGLLILVLIIIVLGGGGYATRDIWMPEVEPYLAELPGFGGSDSAPETTAPSPVEMLNERIATLEQSVAQQGNSDSVMTALKEEKTRVQSELDKALARIDDLEARLAEVRTLASAVTSSTGAEVDLAPILSRIDGLEQNNRATSDEVAALSEKVQTIASRGPGSAGSGIVLAVAQLRDAALSGRPYDAQLDALKSVAAGNTEIIAAASRLNDGADAGLPTVESLQSRFSAIAGDIVAQSRVGDGDWLQQAAGRLSALVSLRRTDGGSGNPIEDAVADIEKSLMGRDTASAVKTANALSDILEGEAKRILEPWLLDAKTRATAERALDAMHASALAALEG